MKETIIALAIGLLYLVMLELFTPILLIGDSEEVLSLLEAPCGTILISQHDTTLRVKVDDQGLLPRHVSVAFVEYMGVTIYSAEPEMFVVTGWRPVYSKDEVYAELLGRLPKKLNTIKCDQLKRGKAT